MRPKYDGNEQGPLETLEEPLYVSSPLRIRARIRMLGRGCELEISRTLLTADLRIMEMSEFEVILRMDWLIASRVVIDCERRRITAYTQDGTPVVFQGTVNGLAREPYPRGRGRPDLDLPRVVRECVNVFQMSYLDHLHIGM